MSIPTKIVSMAEPTSTSATGVIGLFVIVFGPLAGEWAAIIFAALAGAMWAVGRAPSANKLESFWLLIRLVLAAVIFTSVVATLVESQLGWPAQHALAPVAFIIGFFGDRWQDILKAALDVVLDKFVRGKDGI